MRIAVEGYPSTRQPQGRFLKRVSVKADGQLESDHTVDASLYALWYFGMFDPGDPRIERTMKAVVDRLSCRTDIGGLARYTDDMYHWDSSLDDQRDEVPGNPWVISTLWLAQYYTAKAQNQEELAQALPVLEWACIRAMRSGVLAEQYHPLTGEPLSVSPLTWSHATVVTAVREHLERFEELAQ